MDIKIAEHAGMCVGVRKAIKIAFDAAENSDKLCIKGQLVHNPRVVSQLEAKGVRTIYDVTELNPGDRLIIRAHGEPVGVYEYCEKNHITIIDASCLYVKKAHQIAADMHNEGRTVIIVGKLDHPEVIGIKSYAPGSVVAQSPEDVRNLKGKIGILSQTTQPKERFDAITAVFKANPEVRVANTICGATSRRQSAAVELCQDVDVMLVIGGKNSANTGELYEICRNCTKSYWIVDSTELKKNWFAGIESIGITAGASTPDEVIDEVVAILKKYN